MKKKPKVRKPQTALKRTPSSKASTTSTANPWKWIRIRRPFPLPAYVKTALQKLDEAGHIAYVVGGSVRDFLLDRPSKDHDIATSATPDELEKLFPDAVTVGKAFGVLKIPIRTDAPHPEFLEIATFRKDLHYEDHRHPEGVEFSGPGEDAERRDFTINALFYDPKTARILDTVGGMTDLKAGLLRAIGNPKERFREDALRLLRAVRFATSLRFEIDPATTEAIKSRAHLITKVSGERLRDELTLMWTGPHPSGALRKLSELSLLQHVFPELEAMKGVEQSPIYHPEGDVWKHTLKLMESLAIQNPAPRSPELAWGALLHDVGKPVAHRKSEGKNFNNHDKDGAELARKICERLKMSNSETDTIVYLVENHMKFKDTFGMRESTLQRFIRHPSFELLLALHRADATASEGNLAFYEFCRSRYEEARKQAELVPAKLITGQDLIQLGLSPGPTFTQILRTIEDLALEKRLFTKEEALEYVVKHFVK